LIGNGGKWIEKPRIRIEERGKRMDVWAFGGVEGSKDQKPKNQEQRTKNHQPEKPLHFFVTSEDVSFYIYTVVC
jgi:hypothetical protein